MYTKSWDFISNCIKSLRVIPLETLDVYGNYSRRTEAKFLTSRVWVRVPVVTLVSLSMMLYHSCISDGTLVVCMLCTRICSGCKRNQNTYRGRGGLTQCYWFTYLQCSKYPYLQRLISQNNQIHRKTKCLYYRSELYCDITLYLAIPIDLQL